MRSLQIVCVALMGAVLGSFVLLLPAQDLPSRKRSDAPSGAELYARHCAVCHGNDFREPERFLRRTESRPTSQGSRAGTAGNFPKPMLRRF